MLEICGSAWEGAYLPEWSVKVPSKAGVGASAGKVRPMLKVVPDSAVRDDSGVSIAVAGPSSSVIDEIVREGARRMLAEALELRQSYCGGATLGGADDRVPPGARPLLADSQPRSSSDRKVSHCLPPSCSQSV